MIFNVVYTMSLNIYHIQFVMLVVRDMESAIAFYRDMLGMQIKILTTDWVEFELGETVFILRPESADRKVDTRDQRIVKGCLLGFEVPNLRLAIEDLRLCDVSIRLEPTHTPHGYIAEVADPDGHPITLTERNHVAI